MHLVDCAARENDIVVASVFVNPVQFNNPNDLAKYPRDLEGDASKLAAHHVDYIFAPSVDEMYPEEVTKTYVFGQVDKVMEGKYRPGHFNGVAVVVHRLFNIVEPGNAYFGEKDFQQLAVIRKLAEQEHIPVNVIGCKTIREPDGLAMSSRNQRLTPRERKEAPFILMPP
ncbi:MAG: pantoate--beta-alanine ligase [Bacteroidales bacterium]|nr:pantoate--beta-alanine ligase [Bacteroidales bacterium]